jgi:bidirectional [NiFe] hydrogenase diaphorase subunit
LLSLLDMICTIRIDSRELRVASGTNLLWAALDNGIDIPNLCSLKDMPKPPASCRLCYVEIAGRPAPVTACTEVVADGMVVTSQSPEINRLRKFSFDLLLSRHHVDCGACVKNRNCSLQQIARTQHFKILSQRFKRIETLLPADTSHPQFNYDPNKCVLCGRCVYICHSRGAGVLDFAYRGIDTRVSTFAGIPLAETGCNSCLECVRACPVGSLYEK